MKRFAALALCLLLLLTACGGEDASEAEPLIGGGSANAGAAAEDTDPQAGNGASEEIPLHDQVDPGLDPDADVIEIREKLFIAQTNEIFLNYPDYVGKAIRYEGIYMHTEIEDTQYDWVVRWGPGCCGNDGSAGFEVRYDGEWPEQNDWVEVLGTIETYDLNGWDIVYVQISSLTVKEERGQEYVDT